MFHCSVSICTWPLRLSDTESVSKRFWDACFYKPEKVNSKSKLHEKAQNQERPSSSGWGVSSCQSCSKGSWRSWPYIWARRQLIACMKKVETKRWCLQSSESEENFTKQCSKLVTLKDSTVILWLAVVGGPQEGHQAEAQQPGMSGTLYPEQLWILATQHTWHRISPGGDTQYLVQPCSSAI